MRLFGRGTKAARGLPDYWNESVVERIQSDAGVVRETARTWFNEMLVFLDMAADSKQFLSPPRAVDVAWHAFILHTRDYEDYCRQRYGRLIYHQPTGAPDPDAYRRAYERRATAGPIDNALWVPPAVAGGAVAGGAAAEAATDHGVGATIQGDGGGFFGNLFGAGGSDSGSGGGDFGGGSSCGGGGGG